MSQALDSYRITASTRLRVRLTCASALALVMLGGDAYARALTPEKPSVEVHLEVLKELEATARGTSFAAPVEGRDSIAASNLAPVGSPAPAEKVTSSGRKVPSEQPMVGQYGKVERRVSTQRMPVNVPFGQAQAPLPKTITKSTPAAKPKAVAKATSAPKPVVKEKVVAKAAPVVPAPKPPVVKPAPEVAALPPVVTPPVANTQPAPSPIPDFSAIEPPTAPALAAPEALPEIALPEAPAIPELKPDIALPEPMAMPPLPVPQAASPDVLVMNKGGADLPAIPALPVPGQAAAPEPELMPSLSKRMDTLFAKQPEKTGIIEDKTTIEDPSIEAQKRADATAARLAESQEAARQAQLKAQEALQKQAQTPSEVILPKSAEAPALKSTEIAAPPALPMPTNGLIPAGSPDDDLPPPALPSLTPIIGEGNEKSSLEIVQPQEGVMAQDLPSETQTAAAMIPMDAPLALPKVTTGESKPLALPTLPVPNAKNDIPPPPPIPDFSAVKEETPEPIAVKPMPTLPKPAGVKQEDVSMPALAVPEPITEGGVAASFTFEKDKTDLDADAKAKLNGLAERIKKEDRQVRIVAYAAGTAEQASIARRISLSRALQVRAFLIDKGVNQLKINVQALGNKESAERADIYLK